MKLRKTASVVALATSCVLGTAIAQTQGLPAGTPGATTTIDGRYLPNPPQVFRGQVSPNAVNSKPYWPQITLPPKGAPNVLLIMTDDGVSLRRRPSAA